MFTGIVEELGRLRRREPGPERPLGAGGTVRFEFAATVVLEDAKIGDSISHNGCCLTVVDLGEGWYAVDAVEETLSRTNLGDLAPDDPVNLERPVRPTDRLGGHIVQGHVDAVAQVVSPAPDLRLRLAADLLRYVVEKGSVTVDGCSLTVVDVLDDGFTVAIIPHTAAVTTLGRRHPGERVNVEVDVVAKYVERLVGPLRHGTAATAASGQREG